MIRAVLSHAFRIAPMALVVTGIFAAAPALAEAAIRRHVVVDHFEYSERGIDPRGFSLMAFGGAGPLHGVALAEAIAAKNVISPLHPGITAAMGLLVTEPRYEFTQSALAILQDGDEETFANIDAIFGRLRDEAVAQLTNDGFSADQQSFVRIAECRYVGQGFELRVPVPDGRFDQAHAKAVVDGFFAVHRKEYGHAFENQAVETVTLRVIGTARTSTLELPLLEHGGRRNPSDAALYSRPTTFDDGEMLETTRYLRSKLKADDIVTGPAIIVQQNSTTIVPHEFTATVMQRGDIVVRRSSEEI